MLEQIRRMITFNNAASYRDVAPVSPYPRITPKQERQNDNRQSDTEKRRSPWKAGQRRFTAMRELVESLKDHAPIVRVDFNTANQELIAAGLGVAEEDLVPLLLQLKVPLAGIDEMIQQLRQQSLVPKLVSGRTLADASDLIPVAGVHLSEYLMLFEQLQISLGSKGAAIYEEVNSSGRFLIEQNQLRLSFTKVTTLPVSPGDSLVLTISIQVGAVEIDENGRRAIFYQRPNGSYALYSDKTLDLSI